MEAVRSHLVAAACAVLCLTRLAAQTSLPADVTAAGAGAGASQPVAVATGGSLPRAVSLAHATAAEAHTSWLSDASGAALVVPQQRVYALRPDPPAVAVTGVIAHASIDGPLATTTLRVELRNTGPAIEEARLLLALPADANVRAFDFLGTGELPSAMLLPREDARLVYETLTSRVRDPALLELVGSAAVQSSVFPVEPGGRQVVSLTYEQVLAPRDGRVEYVLPRSEVAPETAVPWRITVRVQGTGTLGALYSSSHEVRIGRLDRRHALVATTAEGELQHGPFHLVWTPDGADVSGTVLSHRSDEGGGHLLLLAGAPPLEPDRTLPREVTLVLDRSGSMRGDKWEQTVEAALQVVAGLRPGEAFNLIDYADRVERFAPAPVEVGPQTYADVEAYVRRIGVGGGTNLRDALVAALEQPAREGRLPVVLFLTDGLPTIGVRDEALIRRDAAGANRHGRRVFCFGVGHDVNAPLLDALADATRATTTFVQPGEDVEAKIGETARRLHGPVLAAPTLVAVDAEGRPLPDALRDVLPEALPDLFAGEQITVAARWAHAAPFRLRLEGQGVTGRYAVELPVDIAAAPEHAPFVARTWAARRIAALVDRVRQAGADPSQPATAAMFDELIGEVVHLSTTYGVLTEYTAFMAQTGTPLSDVERLAQRVRQSLRQRSQQVRSGRGAVSQAINLRRLRGQAPRIASFLDSAGKRVRLTAVQQIGDLVLFRVNQRRWVDARIIRRAQQRHAPAVTPDPSEPLVAPRVLEPFTPEHAALAERLRREGRAAVLALRGELYLLVDDVPVLVRPPAAAGPGAPAADAPDAAPAHADERAAADADANANADANADPDPDPDTTVATADDGPADTAADAPARPAPTGNASAAPPHDGPSSDS